MARIFVVDDDMVVRELSRVILQRGGHEVVTLGDGQEALDALEQSVPDILVTDLMMPRVDGVELVRRIRADRRWSTLPIVILTARGGPDDWRRAQEAGAKHFLTKPFSSAQLLDTIRELMPPAGVRPAAD
jgi:CheY-like chemotaxis protein